MCFIVHLVENFSTSLQNIQIDSVFLNPVYNTLFMKNVKFSWFVSINVNFDALEDHIDEVD